MTIESWLSLLFFSEMTVTMPDSKRFYVGNLSGEVQDKDLEKLFRNFGSVSKIEIKNKADVDGNVLTTFAFVTLDSLAEESVVRCIQKLNNSIWKKQTIKVQQAQESFLSRLQRERTEVQPEKPRETRIFTPHHDGANSRKVFTEEPALFEKKPTPRSLRADDKTVVDFEAEENGRERVNKLERTAKLRVYHSSSDESDDDGPKAKKAKKSSTTGDILRKLESFDGGFWKDEEVSLEPIPSLTRPKMEEPKMEELTAIPSSLFTGSQENESKPFSLLGTFGQSRQDASAVVELPPPPSSTEVTDTFAFKLKEKVAMDSVKGDVEPFFFLQNDKRLSEARSFLSRRETLDEVRTKYEEKRPILASIIKKKIKNKSKKASAGGTKASFVHRKGKRKFQPSFRKKKGGNKPSQ